MGVRYRGSQRLLVSQTTTKRILDISKEIRELSGDSYSIQGQAKIDIAKQLNCWDTEITRVCSYAARYNYCMNDNEVFRKLAPYFDNLCYKYLARWFLHRGVTISMPDTDEEAGTYSFLVEAPCRLKYTPTDYQLLALICYYNDVINTSDCPEYATVAQEIEDIFTDDQIFFSHYKSKLTTNKWLLKAHHILSPLVAAATVEAKQAEREREIIQQRELARKNTEDMQYREKEAANRARVAERRAAFLARMEANEAMDKERKEAQRGVE